MNPHQTFCATRASLYASCTCKIYWSRTSTGAFDTRPGVGKVTFIRTDGKEVIVEDVLFDSIAPDLTQPSVIVMETEDEEKTIHVPFVASWTVECY